jgi:hypothetical protein
MGAAKPPLELLFSELHRARFGGLFWFSTLQLLYCLGQARLFAAQELELAADGA